MDFLCSSPGGDSLCLGRLANTPITGPGLLGRLSMEDSETYVFVWYPILIAGLQSVQYAYRSTFLSTYINLFHLTYVVCVKFIMGPRIRDHGQ